MKPFYYVLLAALTLVVDASIAASHKLRVHDRELAQRLEAGGARKLADYGAFVLFEADEVESVSLSEGRAELRDRYDVIELHAGHINTRSAEARALRKPVGAFKGKRMHLVQFVGPVQPEWQDTLEGSGVRIVTYIPHNAYLVYGDSGSLARLQSLTAGALHVQWDGEYADDYKIHPRARAEDAKGRPRALDTDQFSIQLVADAEANAETLKLIHQHKLAPVAREDESLGYRNVIVRLPPGKLRLIAAQPDVVSIQPYITPQKFCERQDQIIAGNLSGNSPSGPGYLAWLTSKEFTQTQFTLSDFAVDVTDSGVDNGTNTPDHFGLYVSGIRPGTSRVVYNRLEGSPNPGSTIQGCDGHGNINAHIIAGYNDLTGFPHADGSGYRFGLGVCPFVKVGSSVIFDPNSFTSPDYEDLQSRAYRDKARFSSNSWGEGYGSGIYNSDSQRYDALVRDAQPTGSAVPNAGNQQMVIVFAAGNSGPGPNTVGYPGTGKNVFTVAAGENVHPFGGADGCGIGDSGANSANDIISFSSRGPCDDGRIKPDITAPGTHVSGGVAQASNPGSNGTAIACFDGSGVCGGPSGSSFWPTNQQFYTASSGTSHSTPGVAGGCALTRQYFINQGWTAPSPAMTKAYLMNSARYMTGTGANDTLPSNNQGMGSIDLGRAFDGVARMLYDQLTNYTFTATGQSRTFIGGVVTNGRPFRVTLAWTDAPGATSGNAYKNDLDLTVSIGGQTYKGNVFSGANSTTGGAADAKNNVESVFLPAGVTGPFAVSVTAANINSDGVPNYGGSLDQDFALVIYNGEPANTPVIVADSSNITAESCVPGNGVIDSNETVTVSFALKNIGNVSTTNMVATLQTTGGVVNPSGPQTYGVLNTNGTPVAKSFTFRGTNSCGSTLTATLATQDGTNSLNPVQFQFLLGAPQPTFTQNFDGVTAPALPTGWTTSAGGGQSAWVTSTAQRDTLPNSAFSTDPASVGSNQLVSPAIPIVTQSAQLSFRNYYNTEAGYDGGVLEIKIGAGEWQDILAAGASFASGAYNSILSASYSNPLGGREAWSGNSGGFITTTVNLPASAAGQNIQLRWRCGTDNSVAGTGWYIDTISISERQCCLNVTSPSVSITSPTNNASFFAPANITITATASTVSGTVAQVDFLQNNSLIGSDTTSPYSIDWNNVPAGSYDLTAIAHDSYGQTATSTTVNVNVLVPQLTWLGTVDTNWDLTTANWSGDGTVYANGAAVTFKNSGVTVINTNVFIQPAGVAPGSVFITNTTAKTFAFYGGDLAGSSGIIKTGSGTAVFSNYTGNLTFAGGATTKAGTLRFDTSANGIASTTRTQWFGSGAITIDGGNFTYLGDALFNGHTNVLANSFSITAAGGTLTYGRYGAYSPKIVFSGAFTFATNAVLTCATSGSGVSGVDANGHELAGTITLRGTNSLRRVGLGGSTVLTISGNIVNGAGVCGLIISNGCTSYTANRHMKIIGAANTYSGGTVICNDGLSNTVALAGAVEIGTNSTLGTGNVTVEGGGLLRLMWTNNIAPTATLELKVDATLALEHQTGTVWIAAGVTNTVAALILGPDTYTAGIFASNAYPSYITGAGAIRVTGGLPAVTVTAPDPTAAEWGADPGQFTIARNGGVSAPLSVVISIGGSAANGTDYLPAIASPIVIAAGNTSTNIIITPVDEGAAEDDETVTLTIQPDAAYTIGAGTNATITIADRPIDQWRLTKFGANANNPAIAGDTADPDGDGINNLMEYALNLEPLAADVGGLPAPVVDSDHLTLTFRRWKADVTYTPEVSSDPGSGWTNTGVTEVDAGGGNTKAIDPETISASTKRFIRIKVNRL